MTRASADHVARNPARTPRPAPRYATPAEAADYIRLDTETLRRWARTGVITEYRIGTRVVRFDLNELDQMLAAGGTVK